MNVDTQSKAEPTLETTLMLLNLEKQVGMAKLFAPQNNPEISKYFYCQLFENKLNYVEIYKLKNSHYSQSEKKVGMPKLYTPQSNPEITNFNLSQN